MPRRRIDVSVSHDEFEDLNNALEDHRDGFTDLAKEAANGFGLEPEYWSGRASEVQNLLEKVQEHSREEADTAGEPAQSDEPAQGLERGGQPDPRD
ncbi:hypothetical protein QMQ05_15460 [Glutamicibacter ectropisis]|uniref:Centromere-binding protein ParB C-terminal domain-containing protein n=1 Tax=Glutamicibacter ectropisis TaxID=3046593 RepID=A0AAU6WCL7_9MICC